MGKGMRKGVLILAAGLLLFSIIGCGQKVTDPDVIECVPDGEWEALAKVSPGGFWLTPSGKAYFRFADSQSSFDGENWEQVDILDGLATEKTCEIRPNYKVMGAQSDENVLILLSCPDESFLVHKEADSWSDVQSFMVGGWRSVWVGEDGTAYVAGERGLLRYDGSAWNRVEDPVLRPPLVDVWGISFDNVYVSGVGRGGQDSRVYRFDGASWTDISAEVLPSESSDLTGMIRFWGSSPEDVFLVNGWGYIAHFNGVSWENWLGYQAADIWGSGPQNVYAVGNRTVSMAPDVTGPDTGVGWEDVDVPFPQIWRYDGAEWDVVDGEWQDIQDDWFDYVWGTGPNDVYAITKGGHAYHYDGEIFSPIELGGATALWGSSQNDVYAVGKRGIVRHFNGSSWIDVDGGTTDDLVAIHGNSSGNIIAAGLWGTTIHSTENGWIEVLQNHCGVPRGSGVTPDAYYLTCVKPDWIVRWDGSSWEEFQVEGNWAKVWTTTEGNVYTAGFRESTDGTMRGVIGYFDGDAWSVLQPDVPDGMDYYFADVWEDGNGKVIAVGTVVHERHDIRNSPISVSGLIAEYNGERWAINIDFENPFQAIWGSSAYNVYAVGGEGQIAHFDGHSWTIREECIEENLYDIQGSDATNIYILGTPSSFPNARRAFVLK